MVDRTPPVRVSTTSETAHGGVTATGAVLDGASFGAPWVVATDGSLFRWTGAAWESVPMPTPPFSTGAKYKAARVLARAKDDVLVNAEYAEKGRGWRTPERYRALLRTRAPRETFRCNPPTNGENYSSGTGFSSWPPLENAAPAGTCTDLVVFVHPHSARTPVGGDYATFRSALKGRKDVGESLTFVDFETRSAKNLAIRVPSKEIGVAVIDALVKRSDLQARNSSAVAPRRSARRSWRSPPARGAESRP
ncbi:MAG: hypothetical protein U0169_03260 [Polyangiaceae bacterium]